MQNLEKPRGTRKRLKRRPGNSQPERTQGLEQLRSVIVGPDQARIGTLEQRPSVTAETVGNVLPEAMVHAAATRERDLATALEPSMARAVDDVARRRPEVLGESLAPTIGAAVRKALADAMNNIIERFNAALERSLSIQAVQWRFQAARSGRPFAEVVLLRTLKYRVEQVLLIDTESSLVLQHVIEPGRPAESPDQIAAMLAAIDAFGREAFKPPPGTHLDKFQLGDLSVWVSRDQWITLAAVVQGTASVGLGRELDAVRERIRLECQPLLEFSGDVAPFAAVRPDIEPLLKTERKPPARRVQAWMVVLALALVVGVVAAVSTHERHARTRAAYVEALASEPGIIVTSAEWRRGHGSFVGLRDPLSRSPDTVLASHGLAPATLVFTPFMSLDPLIQQRRVEHVLKPPAGVTAQLDRGTVHVAGAAPRAWIGEARLLGRSLPGVEGYDDGGLVPSESVEGLRAASAKLDNLVVSFPLNQARVGPEHRSVLRDVTAAATEAKRYATEARARTCLQIVGHADPPGEVDRNQTLSEARAKNVATKLVNRGLDPGDLRPRGAGVWDAEPPRGRSATFHLMTQGTAAETCSEASR